MKDMIPKGTGNSRFLKSAIPEGTSWEQALAMLRAGTLPIDLNGLNAEGVAQQGTPLNKATLLTDDTAQMLGITKEDPTVDDGFRLLYYLTANRRIDEVWLEITSTQSWTVPNGVVDNTFDVWCIGGGGGAGGNGGNGGSKGDSSYGGLAGGGKGGGGGGGGGGFLTYAQLVLSPSDAIQCTIGTGGALGATGRNGQSDSGFGSSATTTDGGDGNQGKNGGTTSFGAYLSALGGYGGNPGLHGTKGETPYVSSSAEIRFYMHNGSGGNGGAGGRGGAGGAGGNGGSVGKEVTSDYNYISDYNWRPTNGAGAIGGSSATIEALETVFQYKGNGGAGFTTDGTQGTSQSHGVGGTSELFVNNVNVLVGGDAGATKGASGHGGVGYKTYGCGGSGSNGTSGVIIVRFRKAVDI